MQDKVIKFDLGLSENDLQRLIDGETFSWSFNAMLEDGKKQEMVTIDMSIFNESMEDKNG